MADAILRPSGGAQWAYCGFSYAAQQAFPELADSEHAREGNAAAYYVAETLLGREPPIGTLAPNGHPIDAEMVECGKVYIDHCRKIMADASPRALLRVETKLTMHGLIHPLNEGTPDFFGVDVEKRQIRVPDFKYGHLGVDAYMNVQLIDYAAGACEALELTREDVADWLIVLEIVQPRCYKREGAVDTWTISGAHLFDLIDWLAQRAEYATRPDAMATTGEHCFHCSANIHCSAFQRVGGAAMDAARRAVVADLPNDALALQLKLVRRAQATLKAMASGLEVLAAHKLRAGERLPGFAMESKAGVQGWTDPKEALQVASLCGVDLRKPPMTTTVLTPKQALAAGFPDELLPLYTTRKSSIELTEVDDNAAAKAFR